MQSYEAQKQTAAGLERLKEYAAQETNVATVQQFLGQRLRNTGDHEGARKAFEAAKAADPETLSADLALADLDTSDGKMDDARRRLSSVVASHPDSVLGQLLFARVEAMVGQPGPAMDRYRRVLTLDSGNAIALNNLAYLLAEGRQPDEALKYAQQAKQLSPDNPSIDDTLGWTYYQKGMYSLAVTHLQSAVSRESTARRQYHLAMACSRAGDTNQGRKALEAALKLDPKLPEAQIARQMLPDASK